MIFKKIVVESKPIWELPPNLTALQLPKGAHEWSVIAPSPLPHSGFIRVSLQSPPWDFADMQAPFQEAISDPLRCRVVVLLGLPGGEEGKR